jgi:hypothetical protein
MSATATAALRWRRSQPAIPAATPAASKPLLDKHSSIFRMFSRLMWDANIRLGTDIYRELDIKGALGPPAEPAEAAEPVISEQVTCSSLAAAHASHLLQHLIAVPYQSHLRPPCPGALKPSHVVTREVTVFRCAGPNATHHTLQPDQPEHAPPVLVVMQQGCKETRHDTRTRSRT